MTRRQYEKYYSMLHPHQRLFVVPGLFGWNRTECTVETQTRALLDKLEAFWAWAEQEPLIVGMFPWHLNDRSRGNPDKDLGLGAVNFPQVVAELKKLNVMIAAGPAARAPGISTPLVASSEMA